MNQLLTFATLLIAVTIAVPAMADADQPPFARSDRERAQLRLDQRGDRINTRLDEKGFALSERYSRQAALAEAAGRFTLAHRLQVKGELVRQHFDRRGDRVDARPDRRGERIGRNFDRLHWHDDNRDHRPGDRPGRHLACSDNRDPWRFKPGHNRDHR